MLEGNGVEKLAREGNRMFQDTYEKVQLCHTSAVCMWQTTDSGLVFNFEIKFQK